MTHASTRSFWTPFANLVIVGVASTLLGCASAAPVTPVMVADVKSLAGTWKGTVYRTGIEPDDITLTIHEDGTYDFVSVQPGSTLRGKGKIVISEGRILIEGEGGRAVGTLLRNPAGYTEMHVDATLSDNSTLSAKLWPSP